MRIFIHKHYKKREGEREKAEQSNHNLLIASKCCACCKGDVFKRYLSPPTVDYCRPHKLQSTCSWGSKSSKLQEKEKKSWAHKSFSHVLSVRGAKTHGNSAEQGGGEDSRHCALFIAHILLVWQRLRCQRRLRRRCHCHCWRPARCWQIEINNCKYYWALSAHAKWQQQQPQQQHVQLQQQQVQLQLQANKNSARIVSQ